MKKRRRHREDGLSETKNCDKYLPNTYQVPEPLMSGPGNPSWPASEDRRAGVEDEADQVWRRKGRIVSDEGEKYL
jgi:hypothetical protein